MATEHECCERGIRLPYDEDTCAIILGELCKVCAAFNVYPADVLNWANTKQHGTAPARKALCKALREKLQYVPAAPNKRAQVGALGNLIGGKLSYPALAYLVGARCHQGVMRLLEMPDTESLNC